MKKLSKKLILFQIFCGVLFSIGANPLFLESLYKSVVNSNVVIYIHILFFSFLLLRAIIKYSPNGIKDALNKKYFEYFRNYFTIFLATAFECFFFSFLIIRFIIKKEVNTFYYLILPISILFISILFVSYFIEKNNKPADGFK